MSPSSADILKAAFTRLDGDATFKAMMRGAVYNHLPQETPTPCCRVRWAQAGEFDTKDSDGLDGFIFVDVWTAENGDKSALEAIDRAVNLLHNAPLTLPSGVQSLILRRDFVDAVVEPDGLTHHTIVRFRHVATT